MSTWPNDSPLADAPASSVNTLVTDIHTPPEGEGAALITHLCRRCGDDMPHGRYALGYRTCLACGETLARERKHCIVPMPKSNYIVVTDHTLLHNLNSSHKGGR